MSKNKIILAIETSNRNGSLSLLVGNEERVGWVGNAQVSRSEDLLLNIRDLYNKSGILLSETNLVAVSVGPGSFTGLRVGLATAQGIAFALGIGCIGVSALESLAF